MSLGENGFEKVGRTDYLEERAIYVDQSVKVTQTRQPGAAFSEVNPVYFDRSETYVSPAVGEHVPFEEKHDFARDALNNTIRDVRFKPDQSFNAKDVENHIEARLAPLLTAHTLYENVTSKPRVVVEPSDAIKRDSFTASPLLYGRMCFGWLHENDPGVVTGHTGLSLLGPALDNLREVRKYAVGVYPEAMPGGSVPELKAAFYEE